VRLLLRYAPQKFLMLGVGRQRIEIMTNEPKAPRFHAYFTRVRGLPVIELTRDQWEVLISEPDTLVPFDISESPLSNVAACVTACAAERFSNTRQGFGDGFVHVYRYDTADGSTPINTDKYQAWTGESVQRWDNFLDMVEACVTSANANLEEDLNNTVFLIKQKADNDHHLPEVPSKVKLIYRAD